MSAAHIPGPWIADGPPSNIHIVQARAPHMRVCFMTSDCPTVANARLVAAAPKLLAAVKGLLAHSCIADSASEDKDIEDHAAERAARSAIAEVEGRTP